MKFRFRWLLLLPALVVAPLFGQTLNFNFSSSSGSLIAFNGTNDTISFVTGGSGFDFGISNSTGTLLSLNSLSGNLATTFSVGAISTVGTNQARAPVSGQGTFSIADDSGHAITATLTLDDVFVFKPAGSFGSLNSLNTVDLVNFSGYTGTDSRLSQLAGRNATFNLAFQFASPGPSLSQLMADSASYTTTYNGTVSLVAIPEPPFTAVGLSVGALLLISLRHRSRQFLVGAQHV